MKMPLLKVEKLRKEFDGVLAVDDVSFSLEKGTITSLMGPNGAGKTTILNMVSRFCQPDKGQIYFNEHELTRLSPCRVAQLGIGRTFQNIRIFPQMSVLENLMLAPMKQKGEAIFLALLHTTQVETNEQEVREKALSYLRTVDLMDKKDQMAESLSHGQRKLLELARTLATGSQLLLLDEPIAGVFPETRKKILDLLCELKDGGKTILFIEHNVQVVLGVSDKVIVLNYGEKIAEGTPDEIKNNKEVIEVYLGRSNATT